MNKRQQIVIIGVGAIMLLMLICPPFESRYQTATFNMGYGFIFMPPNETASVNLGLLLMQWVVVIVGGAIGWFLLKEKS